MYVDFEVEVCRRVSDIIQKKIPQLRRNNQTSIFEVNGEFISSVSNIVFSFSDVFDKSQ